MTDTAPAALAWTRQRRVDDDGFIYFARDDVLQYATTQKYGGWYLQVQKLTVTAGVTHAIGQDVIDFAQADTLKLAKTMAAVYAELGQDFKQHEHGGQSRMTVALGRAYDLEKEGKI